MYADQVGAVRLEIGRAPALGRRPDRIDNQITRVPAAVRPGKVSAPRKKDIVGEQKRTVIHLAKRIVGIIVKQVADDLRPLAIQSNQRPLQPWQRYTWLSLITTSIAR